MEGLLGASIAYEQEVVVVERFRTPVVKNQGEVGLNCTLEVEGRGLSERFVVRSKLKNLRTLSFWLEQLGVCWLPEMARPGERQVLSAKFELDLRSLSVSVTSNNEMLLNIFPVKFCPTKNSLSSDLFSNVNLLSDTFLDQPN